MNSLTDKLSCLSDPDNLEPLRCLDEMCNSLPNSCAGAISSFAQLKKCVKDASKGSASLDFLKDLKDKEDAMKVAQMMLCGDTVANAVKEKMKDIVAFLNGLPDATNCILTKICGQKVDVKLPSAIIMECDCPSGGQQQGDQNGSSKLPYIIAIVV